MESGNFGNAAFWLRISRSIGESPWIWERCSTTSPSFPHFPVGNPFLGCRAEKLLRNTPRDKLGNFILGY